FQTERRRCPQIRLRFQPEREFRFPAGQRPQSWTGMVVLMARFACLLLLAALPLASQTEDRKPDKVINISAERFTYSPSRVKVKQGALVEFVLTSDDTDHGFRIPGAGIDVAIPQSGRG